jgi:hypothetical protein
MTQSISLKSPRKVKAREKRRANGSEIKTKRHEMTQGKVGGQKNLGGFGYDATVRLASIAVGDHWSFLV